MAFVFFCLLAYLWGSVPFSYWIPAKLKGVNVTRIGSGNVGAGNVVFATNFKIGTLCFVLDLIKGFSVGLGMLIWFHSDPLMVLPAVCVLFGHTFSVFLRFKGGKGVATSLGVILAHSPLLFCLLLATAIGIALLTKYVTLGTIGSFILYSSIGFLFLPQPTLVLLWSMAAFIAAMHTDNYRRLLAGTEFRLSDREKTPSQNQSDESEDHKA
ncbi:MAG TPA: glycerol-3-phosphate acyltransferase [Thermotogota bacterium]|nr:glycerol-3-phosphate acyltransferase [Thermotogota bacterium]